MAQTKTAAAAASKWARRTSAAAQDYRDGVSNASGWAAAAQASAERRNAGLMQAISDGRIDAGIQRVGDQGWKGATVAKAGNWATGVNAAQGKFGQAMGTVINDVNTAKAAISGMPNATFEQRQARSAEFQRQMHQLAEQRKTGR